MARCRCSRIWQANAAGRYLDPADDNSDQVAGEFHSLNLNSAPRITSVPTGADALRVLREREFDLVITMMRMVGWCWIVGC